MKSNYHTHSTWCDGKHTPEEMIQGAIAKGFDELGFSSHAMLPQNDVDWVLTPTKAVGYAAEIRALAEKYRGKLRVRLGVEADYIPGGATPSYAAYESVKPEYIIGSIHFLKATDGAVVPVDHEPQLLKDGIVAHFGGDYESFGRGYFAAVRASLTYDFDVVGHPDLLRKFGLFDENADWYREELVKTADAIAASGKLVEVNTGAISRGWLTDAYPSPTFRKLLRERGVKFILSADAHAAEALDCAFDRFASEENYERL